MKLLLFFILCYLSEYAYAADQCSQLFLQVGHAKIFDKKEISKILEKEWGQFKQIKLESIKNLAPYSPGSGSGFLKMYTGILADKKVLVKILHPGFRRNLDMLNEARWYTILNQNGLGVKFLGVTEEDFLPAIVTEYLDEMAILPSHQTLTAEQINFLRPRFTEIKAKMQENVDKLIAANIRPNDLQFLITKDGNVVVIDPEAFTLVTDFSRESFNADELGNLIHRLELALK